MGHGRTGPDVDTPRYFLRFSTGDAAVTVPKRETHTITTGSDENARRRCSCAPLARKLRDLHPWAVCAMSFPRHGARALRDRRRLEPLLQARTQRVVQAERTPPILSRSESPFARGRGPRPEVWAIYLVCASIVARCRGVVHGEVRISPMPTAAEPHLKRSLLVNRSP